ncbi:hypothetical protein D3C78_1613440 [compost metagenome]
MRALPTDPHQADAALLNDLFALGYATSLKPGMASAQGRVPGKRQFLQGGEDSHPIVRPGVLRLQNERGLTEVGPGRERRHALIAQLIGTKHHRQRVALERHGTEDIDLLEIE